MTGPKPTILVIGVGNEYRSDDGVGIVAARRLRECFGTEITVLEETGEGAALMEAWHSATWVLLVDAVHSGAPPGTIHRFDARAAPLPAELFHCSTHAFSVAEAIELARSLEQLPAHLIVYGVEGEKFDAGVGLWPAVAQAVETLVARAAEEISEALLM